MLLLPTVRSGTLIACSSRFSDLQLHSGQYAPSSVQASAIGADATAGKHLFERHCAVVLTVSKAKVGEGLVSIEHSSPRARRRGAKVSNLGWHFALTCRWLFLTERRRGNLAAYVRSLSKIPSEPLPGDTVRGARVYA